MKLDSFEVSLMAWMKEGWFEITASRLSLSFCLSLSLSLSLAYRKRYNTSFFSSTFEQFVWRTKDRNNFSSYLKSLYLINWESCQELYIKMKKKLLKFTLTGFYLRFLKLLVGDERCVWLNRSLAWRVNLAKTTWIIGMFCYFIWYYY